MERVRQDKLREVRAGHDGTWVAHPGLVPVARDIFDEYMKSPNQIQPPKEARSRITAANLLEVPMAPLPRMDCAETSTSRSQYLQSWLGGLGCVPIYDLMEDAATAEICRAQTWQWLRYRRSFRRRTTDHDRFVRKAPERSGGRCRQEDEREMVERRLTCKKRLICCGKCRKASLKNFSRLSPTNISLELFPDGSSAR